jgi:purine nucleosidase
MLTRLIIDTDPGVDDAHAIMLAFAYPDAKIEALTTVAGNVSLERTTANACTILDVLDREDVPIYPGCVGPILPNAYDATYVHGGDGLGDSAYPASMRHPIEEHAVTALIRMANENPGELTLAAIGPLTNVALATRLDPSLPSKFKRLIVMGGAIRGTGNMAPSPSAEFNAWMDPEAARIVFETWPDFDLVSWETTMDHGVSMEQVEHLMAVQTPRAGFFRRITGSMLNYVDSALKRREMYAPDPLALAVALEPGIVTRAERHHVIVELAGTHTRGQTTVDWFDLGSRPPNANIILDLDRARFWEMLRAAVE